MLTASFGLEKSFGAVPQVTTAVQAVSQNTVSLEHLVYMAESITVRKKK